MWAPNPEQRACLQGKLRYDVPLSAFTSWRIGGPAQILYQPSDIADLATFLRLLPPTYPLTWLGLGSNTLVRDGGVRGAVVITQGALKILKRGDNDQVYAEAGLSCAQVARFAARSGLVGGEFLAGIPGTIGGALAMNAGAFGGNTWQYVTAVTTIDRSGQLRSRTPADYVIHYRQVDAPPGEWFVAAQFAFAPGDAQVAQAQIKAHLAKRNHSQPTNIPSCGSVFRNPPGDHAARLIEACGLKGYRLGGAQVSEKHANFIVNTGSASAQDVEALITQLQQTVYAEHGILLQPEAHIIGEKDAATTSD